MEQLKKVQQKLSEREESKGVEEESKGVEEEHKLSPAELEEIDRKKLAKR